MFVNVMWEYRLIAADRVRHNPYADDYASTEEETARNASSVFEEK